MKVPLRPAAENLIGFLLMLVGIGCLYVLAGMMP